jgi:cyclophilin family peptidyl-prolyl cis-trans isomerase
MAPKAKPPAPGSKSVSAVASPIVDGAFVRPLAFIAVCRTSDPDRVIDRLVFELATDVLPRTCENFKQFCAGVMVGDKKNQRMATYKGSRFLRVTPEGLQGGDALNRDDGKGQESIYGPTFEDEALGVIPHRFGTLSMCNSGPNTNGCQFFVCLAQHGAPHLDSRHVSFGKLVEGADFLNALVNELKPLADEQGKISGSDLRIHSCGLVG